MLGCAWTGGHASCAPQVPQGNWHRVDFPRFWAQWRGTILKPDKTVAITSPHSKARFTKGTVSPLFHDNDPNCAPQEQQHGIRVGSGFVHRVDLPLCPWSASDSILGRRHPPPSPRRPSIPVGPVASSLTGTSRSISRWVTVTSLKRKARCRAPSVTCRVVPSHCTVRKGVSGGHVDLPTCCVGWPVSCRLSLPSDIHPRAGSGSYRNSTCL